MSKTLNQELRADALRRELAEKRRQQDIETPETEQAEILLSTAAEGSSANRGNLQEDIPVPPSDLPQEPLSRTAKFLCEFSVRTHEAPKNFALAARSLAHRVREEAIVSYRTLRAATQTGQHRCIEISRAYATQAKQNARAFMEIVRRNLQTVERAARTLPSATARYGNAAGDATRIFLQRADLALRILFTRASTFGLNRLRAFRAYGTRVMGGARKTLARATQFVKTSVRIVGEQSAAAGRWVSSSITSRVQSACRFGLLARVVVARVFKTAVQQMTAAVRLCLSTTHSALASFYSSLGAASKTLSLQLNRIIRHGQGQCASALKRTAHYATDLRSLSLELINGHISLMRKIAHRFALGVGAFNRLALTRLKSSYLRSSAALLVFSHRQAYRVKWSLRIAFSRIRLGVISTAQLMQKQRGYLASRTEELFESIRASAQAGFHKFVTALRTTKRLIFQAGTALRDFFAVSANFAHERVGFLISASRSLSASDKIADLVQIIAVFVGNGSRRSTRILQAVQRSTPHIFETLRGIAEVITALVRKRLDFLMRAIRSLSIGRESLHALAKTLPLRLSETSLAALLVAGVTLSLAHFTARTTLRMMERVDRSGSLLPETAPTTLRVSETVQPGIDYSSQGKILLSMTKTDDVSSEKPRASSEEKQNPPLSLKPRALSKNHTHQETERTFDLMESALRKAAKAVTIKDKRFDRSAGDDDAIDS